jgi:hypothetical protein
MFSQPFIQSKKEFDAGIAARAKPTRESVRRSPTCSGEANYTYEHPGFRVFKGSPSISSYAETLIADFRQVYEEGKSILPYHAAVAALHHKSACSAMNRFLEQPHILDRLIIMPTGVSSMPVPINDGNGAKVRQYIQELYKLQSVNYIQRPLTDASLCIAHAVVRAQVTEISALKLYQRQRLTASASMAALIAIRFGMERSDSTTTNLNHRVVQYVLRRASGSMARADQVAAPYIKADKPLSYIPKSRQVELKQYVQEQYDANSPDSMQPQPKPHPKADFTRSECSLGGPISYHTAKYYAGKCLELIGNEGDAESAERWNYLQEQVGRVRKGEITAHEVLSSSNYGNWVYAIQYTYISAVGMFLKAIDSRRNMPQFTSWRRGSKHSTWHNSYIRNNDPSYVQTVQIVHEMYRFMFRTMTIISPRYIAVFGFNQRYINVIVQRTKFLAYSDGDETSALMFGFLMPSLMTPDIHLDLYVEGHVFQENRLYVKMSDPIFGPLKRRFKAMIPSRHTGTIDRATLLNDVVKRYRS